MILAIGDIFSEHQVSCYYICFIPPKGRLPVKWTAYESLLYGVYTTQSDV